MTDHSHKQFLKRNDLADLMGGGAGFFSRYKLLLAFILVAVVVGFAVSSFVKAERLRKSEEFSARFYEAGKGLKKVSAYQDLIRDYRDVPATALARIRLADKLVDDKKIDEAIKILDEGLAEPHEPGLLSTLLVLKKAEICRSSGKFDKAIQVLDAGKGHWLAGFEDAVTLMKADTLLLAAKQEDARKLYEGLILRAEQLEAKQREKKETEKSAAKKNPGDEIDAEIVKRAKDQIYLLDLGVL